MAQLSFAKRNMRIINLNPRQELSGDEPVNACDVSLAGIPFTREDVDKLCGEYYSRALFTEEGRGNSKVVKPMLTRFKPLHMIDTWYKSRAIITFTFNDEKIEFKKIKIKDVRLECQDGGTAIVSLKLQGYPTDEEMGLLYAHQGKENSVTLYFGNTVDDTVKEKPSDKQQELTGFGEGGAKGNGDETDAGDGAAATH
jgi:hypothetical protein